MENLFKDKTFDITRAETFGFKKSGGAYVYSCNIMNNKFTIRMNTDGKNVQDKLYDNTTGEEYILHKIETANGAFVGRVRDAYQEAINNIINECCVPDVFKFRQTHQVIKYTQSKYQTEPEYLWSRFPRNAVLRRSDNKKWYAAILSTQQNRLYGKSTEIIEILDIRTMPDKIDTIIDNKNIFPGWHMNKKSWISVILDGRTPISQIKKLLDSSFDLAK